jgi:hypothetical protein
MLARAPVRQSPRIGTVARERVASYASRMGDERQPRDPDWDAVPPQLAALDGKRVTITGFDPVKERWNRGDGTIVVVPELFARARRARDDDAAQHHVDEVVARCPGGRAMPSRGSGAAALT